ncbi:MAG: futalosine hydrolase [Candidatus Eremiobacteraeota bacterium]|nr:futalosine hydrolase [Candidatus Eremiobacteraeota bacterium]
MILIVCALAAELRAFAPRAGVEVLAAGIGCVEAAAATARQLARAPYAAVLNVGLGGAFRGSAAIGDAILITHETLADFGLEGGASLTLPKGATLVEHVAADAHLLDVCRDLGFTRARGVTVTQVTATDATATRLHERFGADVESMEGFAVLRAAALAGVPALELRGISNYVGDRRRAEWDFEAGARAATHALGSVLDRLEHGRNSP